MPDSFERAVKKATRVELSPPKSKHVEHILLATQSGEAGVAEVMRSMTPRIRDATWTIAFKSLIIVHLMIKEGAKDVTLSYLAVSPSHRLAINSFTDVQTQGHNIRRYSEYLLARAKAFEKTGVDYVRSGDAHIRRLTVDKGLLRETEIVQDQIKALLRCTLLDADENEIALTAFRLLTRDLLDLFTTLNEAVMNVLQRYFELSRPDAERAINIYRRFCKQTEQVVIYLRTAQQHQHAMRLEIPKIKHAPIDLADTLQEYLDDKDFDIHRRQYLAQQEAKRTGKPIPKQTLPAAKIQQPLSIKANSTAAATSSSFPSAAPVQQAGPAPNLIDFFESIEQNQQPMAQTASQYQQPATFINPPQSQPFNQNGFATQQFPQAYSTVSQPQQQPQQQQQQQPLMQQQTAFTGSFANTTSPVQYQQNVPIQDAFGQTISPPAFHTQPAAATLQPQSTNPFRKSLIQQPTGSLDAYGPMPTTMPHLQQNGNPFAREQQASTSPPFPNVQQSQATGVNPFAAASRTGTTTSTTSPPVAPLQVQPTGSTNPFRQSVFVNQQTGNGWQNSQQATMGGLEQLPTVPVFPRPGQNQQASSPWA